MAKKSSNPEYLQYLNNKTRIRNKTKKLEKKIKVLELGRKKETINPNTQLPPKKRPIENLVKSSRIGRKKESFQMEEFKRRPSKKPQIFEKGKK